MFYAIYHVGREVLGVGHSIEEALSNARHRSAYSTLSASGLDYEAKDDAVIAVECSEQLYQQFKLDRTACHGHLVRGVLHLYTEMTGD